MDKSNLHVRWTGRISFQIAHGEKTQGKKIGDNRLGDWTEINLGDRAGNNNLLEDFPGAVPDLILKEIENHLIAEIKFLNENEEFHRNQRELVEQTLKEFNLIKKEEN